MKSMSMRCPDDAIAVMPNHYTIHAIPESPTKDCIFSTDVAAYAVGKGWWPKEMEFDFALAYQDPKWVKIPHNTRRQKYVTSLLLGKEWTDESYPFSVKAARRVSPNDVKAALSAHPESGGWLRHASDFDETPSACRRQTIESLVIAFGSKTEQGRVLADQLIDTIRAEDSGHLVTFACCCATEDICSSNLDFIAFNTYPGWHNNSSRAYTPASLRQVIKERFDSVVKYMRKTYGEDKPIIVGEAGCYSVYGSHDPMAAQWTEEYQSEYLDHWLDIVKASPEMAGFTVWQFCDARTFFRGGSDIRTKPLGYNMAGLFDRYRNAKLAATTVKRYYTGAAK